MNDRNDTFDFAAATCSEAGFAPEPLQELRMYLQTAVANGSLPGAVIFLARGDRVVLHEAIGQGDLATGRPLRADAQYRLHSMTKPFTAVAMLLLYEEGKWSFDDPVSVYVPEVREALKQSGNRATREPLLRHLFTHTSGHGFGSTMDEIMDCVARIDIFGARSLADLVARYHQLPLRYEPGTSWEYSVGMDIEALIVERISGQRYDHFLQQRLFAPLGMRDTGFALSPAHNEHLVPGYAMDATSRRLRPANLLEMQDLMFPIGGSSFRSTASDYARFARMLLKLGSLGDTHILKAETARLVFENLLPEPLLQEHHNTLHYRVGGGNGFSLNGLLCIDPAVAGRPVGRNTYEWAGAHGPWFWADPEHDIVFVGMTNRAMPHPELAPLSLLSQELVYRALRR
ncbi:serine hydrolase [Pelomonas sp. KK5]|uniref:serine hydrolase domain-containing protein n=1 Tax=Pelomonas sp. KK5 TaxID=1855730 RepID=UPI00097BBA90|nr:serine hydrolase domain-containing protein [Pelomonas sp. KK5]